MDTADWYNSTVQKFGLNENWKHKLVLWNEIGFKDYNPSLPSKLLKDIDNLFEETNYDVVFMDGGYHVRGDIVNIVINKFQPKFILIHDVNYAFEIDGYHRISVPENYVIKKDINGEGTMIFIKIN